MPEHAKNSMSRKTWIETGIAVSVIAVLAAGAIYWVISDTRVSVPDATVEAPVIDLNSSTGGEVQDLFVNEGDEVALNAPVAEVGTEIIKAESAGIIVSIPVTMGSQIAPGATVAQMIDPSTLRVVGEVDEDKGLSKIAIGDPVEFTVDAFGSKTYSGVVDEIAPTAVASGVVFNISDQRQTSPFDVKVRFNTSAYPELKNGMAARMWIYTK
ncbi:MAG: efflux RND transporter periplasmic adaptor subunit [Minisyncoccia bacterium]